MSLSQGWIDTVRDGLTNPAWDEYDELIYAEVGPKVCSGGMFYNARLVREDSGFPGVDWKLVKAIVWVESGGPSNPAWKTRPMQIGNAGDPGYGVVKTGADHSDVIMTQALASELRTGNINDPKLNVRAGIAYLFTCMARFQFKSVVDPDDQRIYTTTILKGEGLDRIAKRVGTTEEELRKLRAENSHVALRIGETVRYRKASMRWKIVDWYNWADNKVIGKRYNSGDKAYGEKLDYVYKTLFPLVKR